MKQVFLEIAASQAHGFLFAALKWTVLGTLAGIVVPIVCIIIFRKLGWYASAWKQAGWVRWLVWSASVIACMLCLGAAGFWKGVINGSERVVHKSQLGTRVLPEVADVIADGLAALHLYLNTNAPVATQTNISARVQAFREGGWELQAAALCRELENVRSDTVSNLLAKLEREAIERSPVFKDGLANKVLHQTLAVFGAGLLQDKLDASMERLGLAQLYQAVREKLVVEARQAGNPDTIKHKELSGFLLNEAVLPGVIKPIRAFSASQAKVALFLGILVLFAPVLLFRLTCGRMQAAPAPSPERSQVEA